MGSGAPFRRPHVGLEVSLRRNFAPTPGPRALLDDSVAGGTEAAGSLGKRRQNATRPKRRAARGTAQKAHEGSNGRAPPVHFRVTQSSPLRRMDGGDDARAASAG